MIKLVLADDQVLFRTMLEEIIRADQRFDIVGCAENGREAVEKVAINQPHVVLLDIRMPEMDGLTALEQIKNHHPQVKVVILTTFEDPFSIHEALLAGADGYLLKNMKPAALLSAILCVANDIMVVHREIYEHTLKPDTFPQQGGKQQMDINGISFNRAEVQMMKCIAEGKTNKEMATLLNYSEGTIKNRVSQLFSKTGVTDRTQISVYALKNNLV